MITSSPSSTFEFESNLNVTYEKTRPIMYDRIIDFEYELRSYCFTNSIKISEMRVNVFDSLKTIYYSFEVDFSDRYPLDVEHLEYKFLENINKMMRSILKLEIKSFLGKVDPHWTDYNTNTLWIRCEENRNE